MCTGYKGLGLITALISLVPAAIGIAFAVVTLQLSSCQVLPAPPEEINVTQYVPEIPTLSPDPDAPLPEIPDVDVDGILDDLSAKIGTYLISPLYYQYFHSQQKCLERDVAVDSRLAYWRNVSDFKASQYASPATVKNLMTTYLVENVIWLTGSILMIIGSCWDFKALFHLCKATQAFVVVYDLVLVIIFALDLQTQQDYEPSDFLGELTKTTMVVNTALMLLFVSRFGFMLLVNVAFLFVMQIASRLMERQGRDRRHQKSGHRHGPSATVFTLERVPSTFPVDRPIDVDREKRIYPAIHAYNPSPYVKPVLDDYEEAIPRVRL